MVWETLNIFKCPDGIHKSNTKPPCYSDLLFSRTFSLFGSMFFFIPVFLSNRVHIHSVLQYGVVECVDRVSCHFICHFVLISSLDTAASRFIFQKSGLVKTGKTNCHKGMCIGQHPCHLYYTNDPLCQYITRLGFI